MRKYTITFLLLICFLFVSCTNKRDDGCHLEKMKVNGDVVKIETIVQSTMPLTEVFAKAYDPQYIISSYAGNVEIEFDHKGNVKRSKGYGIDGEILFDVRDFKSKDETNFTPCVPIGPDSKQMIDKIKTITTENGNVLKVKYYNDDNLVWTQTANYYDDGLIKSIIKNYESLRIETEFADISFSDTTSFNYLSFDSHNNWTEVEVEYCGILAKHHHTYKIKRQLTYATEEVKPSLINQLQAYNTTTSNNTDHFDRVSLGSYGYIRIPHYMAIQSKNYIDEVNRKSPANYQTSLNYLFLSVYNDNDAYASFSVNLSPGDGSGTYDDLTPKELTFDKEEDNLLEEIYTSLLKQGDIYILKWLPYEYFKVNRHRALRLRYYRYGKGSPIPVYCENYIIPMQDGNVINVIYSFQSNLDHKFRSDFDNAIYSIVFNK